MNCQVCEQKVDRSDPGKITCGDCKSIFHCVCVNLTKSDADYMKTNNVKYRCNGCSTARRKSMLVQTLAVDATSKPPSPSISDKLDVNSDSTGTVQEQQQYSNANNTVDMHKKIRKQNNSQMPTPSGQQPCGNSVSNNKTITLQLLYEELVALRSVNTEMLNTLSMLTVETRTLKEKVNNLESKLYWRAQRECGNAVEITGIPQQNCSNAEACVQKIIVDALGVSISPTYIDHCVVKSITNKNDSSRNRDIICVQFSSNKIKKRVMAARKTKARKLTSGLFDHSTNNRIYINHALTRYTRALFTAAYKIKKEKRYKFLWIGKSSFLLKKAQNERVFNIRTFDDLKLVAD
ncbi:uncharacterized protein [Eurosta solidaginis]|uniref:uncharacterized protein n=1 Tax=Eurosta solidaginis TaxID=178769 RepID=UPI003530BA23